MRRPLLQAVRHQCRGGWHTNQPSAGRCAPDKDELVSNNGVVFGVAAIGEHVVTYGGRCGGQLLDEGASSDKLIIKEVLLVTVSG